MAGGKESFIIKQECFQLAMSKKLDDCKQCVQDHINAKDSREKMLLYLSLFLEHGIPAKMKQMFLFCSAFDKTVL